MTVAVLYLIFARASIAAKAALVRRTSKAFTAAGERGSTNHDTKGHPRAEETDETGTAGATACRGRDRTGREQTRSSQGQGRRDPSRGRGPRGGLKRTSLNRLFTPLTIREKTAILQDFFDHPTRLHRRARARLSSRFGGPF